MKVMRNLKVRRDAVGKIIKGSLVTFPLAPVPYTSPGSRASNGVRILSAGSAWLVKSPALLKNKSYINRVENKGLAPVLYFFSSSQPPVEPCLINNGQ